MPRSLIFMGIHFVIGKCPYLFEWSAFMNLTENLDWQSMQILCLWRGFTDISCTCIRLSWYFSLNTRMEMRRMSVSGSAKMINSQLPPFRSAKHRSSLPLPSLAWRGSSREPSVMSKESAARNGNDDHESSRSPVVPHFSSDFNPSVSFTSRHGSLLEELPRVEMLPSLSPLHMTSDLAAVNPSRIYPFIV